MYTSRCSFSKTNPVRPPRARIGLNGFGQTARILLRCSLEDTRGVDVVAVNVLGMSPEEMLYLVQYDTTWGKFDGYIKHNVGVQAADEDKGVGEYCVLEIAGRSIAVFHEANFEKIPWHWIGVEYVIETTGQSKHLRDAHKHLSGGRARKVLVVGDTADIPLLMYPISCRGYQRGNSVVATGSAAAHAMATIVSLVDSTVSLTECMATLVLPVEGHLNCVDGPTKDPRSWRKGRGALQSILPGRCTEVVQSVIQALPQLSKCLDAITMQVPTFQGAALDLTFRTKVPVTNLSDVIERICSGPLLSSYNTLHSVSQPYKRLQCDQPNEALLEEASPNSVNSLTNERNRDSEVSDDSEMSLPGRTVASIQTNSERKSAINGTGQTSSILLPLVKEEAYVSTDAHSKHTMSLLSVDCCHGLSSGTIFKIVSWFDPGITFCERILDTVVFMRNVDNT